MSEIKQNNKTLSVIIGVLCMLGAVVFAINSNSVKEGSKNKSEKKLIVQSLSEISGITVEDILSKIGEPKEIYKGKVYTYIDQFGKYDLLIDGTIKNAAITMDYDLSIMSVTKLLEQIVSGYKAENTEKYEQDKIDGVTRMKIFDIGCYSKIEIYTKKDSTSIDLIKLEYK